MFPEKIKDLRKEKGLSQGDVARALFVTQQAVSKWESGKGYPDLPTLQALAKLYGVKVDDLVGVEEYEQAKKTKSIRVSPLFAIVLVFFVVSAALAAFVSGSLLDWFHNIFSENGNGKAIGIATVVVFFLSCLALVFFILLSQSRKLRIVRFAEYDGLFFFLYFIVVFIVSRSLGSTAKSDWLYLLIGLCAFWFSSLFFYYERGSLMAQRKAGLTGIALTRFEEKLLASGPQANRWLLIVFLIVQIIVLVPLILFLFLG
jgi:transcriptional regulator with XRE-family HTH domain